MGKANELLREMNDCLDREVKTLYAAQTVEGVILDVILEAILDVDCNANCNVDYA